MPWLDCDPAARRSSRLDSVARSRAMQLTRRDHLRIIDILVGGEFQTARLCALRNRTHGMTNGAPTRAVSHGRNASHSPRPPCPLTPYLGPSFGSLGDDPRPLVLNQNIALALFRFCSADERNPRQSHDISRHIQIPALSCERALQQVGVRHAPRLQRRSRWFEPSTAHACGIF